MIQLPFSEPIGPFSLTSFQLYGPGNQTVPVTIGVNPNGLSATVTPSNALLPNTPYGFYLFSYADLAGNGGCNIDEDQTDYMDYGQCFGGYFLGFTTGP